MKKTKNGSKEFTSINISKASSSIFSYIFEQLSYFRARIWMPRMWPSICHSGNIFIILTHQGITWIISNFTYFIRPQFLNLNVYFKK